MSNPITKVELDCFRGATQASSLAFDPQKDLTILFGENGSGKSTILDAIDVVCNGTVGSLADISVGQGPAKYLASIGSKKGQMKAIVHSGKDSWCATVGQNMVEVGGPETRPEVRILRRKKILDLVAAQPKDRYRQLKRFIDTDVVEQSENSLLAKQKLLDGERTKIEVERRVKLELIEGLWNGEGKPGPGISALEWAEQRTGTSIKELEGQLTNLKDIVADMKDIGVQSDQCVSHRSVLDKCKKEIEQIEQQIKAVPDIKAETAAMLVESLAKAKVYIDAESELEKCPTCQRDMKRDDLIKVVNDQLSEMGPLKGLVDKRAEIVRDRNLAQDSVSRTLGHLTKSLKQFQQKAASTDTYDIEALKITWPDWSALPIELGTLEPIVVRLKTIQLHLEKKRDDLQLNVNQFNSISQSYRGFVDANRRLDKLDVIRTGLARVYEIVHKLRVSFVQGILDSIVDETNRLYATIHPNEKIGLDQLKMDEKRRGSVDQTGEFHEYSGIKPQAILSESHLDTLGFCVWMALTKREHPENTILLIDDVFTSIDNQHVVRIINLLTKESSSFRQVIVSTHLRMWWNKCQNAQGIERIHLGRWSVTNGICIQDAPVEFGILRGLAEDNFLDRQRTASKAGVMLESTLDDLALTYRLKLRKDESGTNSLGELLDASGKLFTKYKLGVQRDVNWDNAGVKSKLVSTDPKSAFDRIVTLKFIRNQIGCHWNPIGDEIPDEDVREFGKATADFIESMTCPNCGHLASKTTSDGRNLRCTCKKQAVLMTPVQAA